MPQSFGKLFTFLNLVTKCYTGPQTAGYCECGNEPLGSINGGEIS